MIGIPTNAQNNENAQYLSLHGLLCSYTDTVHVQTCNIACTNCNLLQLAVIHVFHRPGYLRQAKTCTDNNGPDELVLLPCSLNLPDS